MKILRNLLLSGLIVSSLNTSLSMHNLPPIEIIVTESLKPENNEDIHPLPITPSQAAVDSIIKADNDHYYKTGRGLYVGRPVEHIDDTLNLEISRGNLIAVDCYDALKIVLDAELSNREVRNILKNSKNKSGKFSAPFMVQYLVKQKKWEAYGYYDDRIYENFDTQKKIKSDDLVLGINKSGKSFYRSGDVMFFLTGIFQKTQADSLLKKLTVERGYAIGFQRDGNNCYTLVQKGMFETHSDAPLLGYKGEETGVTEVNIKPLDLHEGRYYARSSVAVFAFPPNN